MHWFCSHLLIAVAGFSPQLTHTELVPADPLLQEFAERVRAEARTVGVVQVTDEMGEVWFCAIAHRKSVVGYLDARIAGGKISSRL